MASAQPGGLQSGDGELSEDAVSGADWRTLDPAKLRWSNDAASKIGGGDFADVFKGMHRFRSKGPGETVAVKLFRGTKQLSPAVRKRIMDEAADIGKIVGANQNLVATHGVIGHPEGVMMAMELVGGGTLHHALGRKPKLAMSVRTGYLADVASGMVALHRCHPHAVVHGDLKLMNVLIATDGKTAKVGDFGLVNATGATWSSIGTRPGGGGGTGSFKAPKQCCRSAVRASDVFSFAMVVYHSLFLILPFDGMTQEMIETKLRSRFECDEELNEEDGVSEEKQRRRWLNKRPITSRRPALSQIRPDAPAALVELMQKCWADDPRDRPTFPDICERIAAIRASASANAGLAELKETKALALAERSQIQQATLQNQQAMMEVGENIQSQAEDNTRTVEHTIDAAKVKVILETAAQLLTSPGLDVMPAPVTSPTATPHSGVHGAPVPDLTGLPELEDVPPRDPPNSWDVSDPGTWSLDATSSWALSLGPQLGADLAQTVAKRIKEEEIDGETLLGYERKDLKDDLGLNGGNMAKLWKAMEGLRGVPAVALDSFPDDPIQCTALLHAQAES